MKLTVVENGLGEQSWGNNCKYSDLWGSQKLLQDLMMAAIKPDDDNWKKTINMFKKNKL